MALEIATDVVLSYIDKAGSVAAVLELGALVWLNRDRLRIISENAELRAQNIAKHAEVKDLAERVVTLVAELKMFLFNERKT